LFLQEVRAEALHGELFAFEVLHSDFTKGGSIEATVMMLEFTYERIRRVGLADANGCELGIFGQFDWVQRNVRSRPL